MDCSETDWVERKSGNMTDPSYQEWFCSGKIYARNQGGGHKCTGYFSSTATSCRRTPVKDVFEHFITSISKAYLVDRGDVHIENLSKIPYS